MNVPPELQKHIDYALGQVASHPSHQLDLDSRQPIYGFFDSLPGLNGRIARTHLAILVAQKMLPLIEQPESGYSTMPHIMCASAERLLWHLRGGMTAEQLDELAQQTTVEALLGQEAIQAIVNPADHPIHKQTIEYLYGLAEEMDSLTGVPASSLNYHAYCVHLAAMNALEEVFGGNWWTRADGAKWAVIAYAGGSWTAFEDPKEQDDWGAPLGVWDYSSPDVQARRHEFWQWWCSEAVPASWKSLQLDEK